MRRCFILLLWAIHACGVDILWSRTSDRANPMPLSGELDALQAHIFVPTPTPTNNIQRVEFWLDWTVDSGMPPTKTEGLTPYDFAGSGPKPTYIAYSYNLVNIPAGDHFIAVRVTYKDNTFDIDSANFTIPAYPDVNNIYVKYSNSDDRSSPMLLSGATIPYEDFVYIFVDGSSTGDRVVQFFMDKAVGTPDNTDLATPFDYAGTDPLGVPHPLDKTLVGPGLHSLTTYVQTASDIVEKNTILFTINSPVVVLQPYEIMVSINPDRSNAMPLDGSTLQGGPSYIFTAPDTTIVSVVFYLNTPETGTSYHKEGKVPFDFTGTAADLTAYPWARNDANAGSNYIIAAVTSDDGTVYHLRADFTVIIPGTVSLTPASISAVLATDTGPNTFQITATASSMDTLTITGLPAWAMVMPNPIVVPGSFSVLISAQSVAVGTYTATLNFQNSAAVTMASLPITLTVNDPNNLMFDVQPTIVNMIGRPDSGDTGAVISVTGAPLEPSVVYTVSVDVMWLRTSTSTQFTAPNDFTLLANTNNLPEGTHTGSVTLQAPNYATFNLPVNLQLTAAGCEPVICNQIRVALPYSLVFVQNNDKAVVDKNGVGTGFTYVLSHAPGTGSSVDAYKPDLLWMDTAKGLLRMKTTAGINAGTLNNADNSIGVGFAVPNQIAVITARLVEPYTSAATGNYEQAGIWFGTDQDNYVKVVWLSYKSGGIPAYAIQFVAEFGGVTVAEHKEFVLNQPGLDQLLRIIVDPFTRKIYGQMGGQTGTYLPLGTAENVPSEVFGFDAAGIDPVIGTRSFAGVMTTHRKGVQTQFSFGSFDIEQGERPLPPMDFTFDRKSHPLTHPTNMVFGPDGKLYVTELYGNVHTLTYDSNLNVVEHQICTTIPDHFGPRLTLGIAMDPTSTPGNIILWVSHSSPDLRAGGLNSGSISRLSESSSGFSNLTTPVTGLPRAEANHGPNSMAFIGNRLWITIGGNTGAGGAVNNGMEFGVREEQWLSAALLYMDPFEPGFDGDCYDEGEDPWGKDPGCDVSIWATGLRNSYDFVHHSNGMIYAGDNGLGLANTGAYPKSPYAPCFGFADPTPYYDGGDNPLEQTDLLYNVKQGKYYGHGNPARDECVYKDGSYQGVPPLPNFVPPMADLGMHASPDGITEYKGGGGCGQLEGNLLVVRYSLGDDIRRIVLSADGESVTSISTLAINFQDPLSIRVNANGDIFVAEHGGNFITTLRFVDNCP
eukprot:TRINITY_DN1142_c0_g1_i2.p1 TRINITY_DN1142_c0_g1~~TRINITY_DN1142_c0_g1_i2.p1  ORF type:complete len:1251 (+),score=317.38 TRINITY_DN1142_c0_g1_i2:77-3754(+)